MQKKEQKKKNNSQFIIGIADIRLNISMNMICSISKYLIVCIIMETLVIQSFDLKSFTKKKFNEKIRSSEHKEMESTAIHLNVS